MAARALAFCGLLVLATSAQAAKPFDVHGLIVGNEGARYVKGVPTLDLQQQRGAIQVRSYGFHNNRPMFAIAFYNAGPDPVNIGLEDIHVSLDGTPLTVFPLAELERQAKKKAWWTKFGVAMLSGLAAGAAANRRDTMHGSITGPYGTYSVSASYPSLAGQLEAGRIEARAAYSLAAIQYQLDATLERLNNHVVQRTTIDPGSTYAGLIVVDKLKVGKPPFDLRINVDWNGERYPFAYVIQKPGHAVPERYSAMLAANAKPRALSAQFASATVTPSGPSAPSAPVSAAPRKLDKGAIFLRSGAVKIPAKTPSGYCLKAPAGYSATGSTEYPVITGSLPRCKEDAE